MLGRGSSLEMPALAPLLSPGWVAVTVRTREGRVVSESYRFPGPRETPEVGELLPVDPVHSESSLSDGPWRVVNYLGSDATGPESNWIEVEAIDELH
jgi:hypothetical protein